MGVDIFYSLIWFDRAVVYDLLYRWYILETILIIAISSTVLQSQGLCAKGTVTCTATATRTATATHTATAALATVQKTRLLHHCCYTVSATSIVEKCA
jgi:hypothetical protein